MPTIKEVNEFTDAHMVRDDLIKLDMSFYDDLKELMRVTKKRVFDDFEKKRGVITDCSKVIQFTITPYVYEEMKKEHIGDNKDTHERNL